VLPLSLVLVGIASTAALAAAAVEARALTLRAGLVATIFGSVIVALGGFAYLALLVLFVVGSVLATRFRFAEKARRQVQEGTHGERGVTNVLAHVILPTGLVVLPLAEPRAFPIPTIAFLYTAALAFGAADTFASEFGVLAGSAVSLLTGKPVPAGTNGGVTLVGELWAFVGALTTGVIGSGLFLLFGTPIPPLGLMVVGVTAAGFIGCQLDSLLGWTLENRGFLTKGGTNFAAMLLTLLVATGVLLLSGAGA
jgi:uncharacterized protein (TIGR00297 family)